MTTTRTAALALVLMSGTAFAAPAQPTRDNAFQRFGKSLSASVHYFKSDLKARNEKAGPGLLKRTMTSVHEKASALGEKITIKMEDLGAKFDAKRDAVAASLSAKRASAMAFGKRVVDGAKANIAQRKLDRAAAKDFKAWLNEKGNENAKTFYKGAAKDESLGLKRTISVVNKIAVVDGALGSIVNPGMLIPTAAAAAGVKLSGNMIKESKRVMAERTVNQFFDKVPADRLELWSKGGVIDRELAK